MIEEFKHFAPLAGDTLPLRILFVGETWCDRHFRIVRDHSDLNAFEFILGGKGTLEIEGQYLQPQQDDVFFLKVGTKHVYQADRDDPWHKLWVVFDGPFAQNLIDYYLPADTYLFPRCQVKKLFEEIVQISRMELPYNQIVSRITVILMQIFLYIHDRSNTVQEDLADLIRKNLDESVEQELRLEDLCTKLNYSKNHLIHVFRQKYGITPYQYLLARRIDAAKAFLIHTNMPVSEIAKTLHYADPQYFSTCFRNATGYSPLKFRKQIRK